MFHLWIKISTSPEWFYQGAFPEDRILNVVKLWMNYPGPRVESYYLAPV